MVSNHRGACTAGDGFGAMEVVLVKRQQPPDAQRVAVVLTVAYDPDVWRLVNEDMDEIASNLMRVRNMNKDSKMHVDESAQLFQRSLQPFFALISATSKEHVMDKLSVSLRKALLLMAMERYGCNREKMCRALGLTKAKLEKEMKLCGLVNQEQRAA
ncbi:hypothetical protein KOM00_04725 [Geomonas sp. Red69]|uniref:Uncharacterized protein n=1 Tax=Geomonas diazotrophica TaxID=2843197 RepID=A0ABX8JJF0_9BACT|nr:MULTISPECIES: hypothetical protein [Geomonas]MBU5636031.1 hypothetical protein [Geomonas diazotrophica]QWV96792.1 hypothetical protein KP005_15770 [Geomonas nitrogeniifigens]